MIKLFFVTALATVIFYTSGYMDYTLYAGAASIAIMLIAFLGGNGSKRTTGSDSNSAKHYSDDRYTVNTYTRDTTQPYWNERDHEKGGY